MADLIERQAAIEIVRHRCKRLTTACVLAVTEIEQLPSAQFATDINVGDTIYRQAAIDAVARMIDTGDEDADRYTAERMLEQLPSAQPEPCEDTVSRQRLLSDLKELVAAWKKYPVMAEQIKGVEAAIGYVEAIPPVKPEGRKGVFIPDITVEMFRNATLEGVENLLASGEMEDISLPSEQRKTGRWIRHIRTDLGPKLNDTIECSECRIAFPTENMFRRSFCPNCGSDNRGESDG